MKPNILHEGTTSDDTILRYICSETVSPLILDVLYVGSMDADRSGAGGKSMAGKVRAFTVTCRPKPKKPLGALEY